MKNLETLPLAKSTFDAIRVSRDKLLAYAGIKIDILSIEDNTIRIRVEQLTLKNNFLLNQKQLVARASSLFTPLNNEFKLHYVALTYTPDFDSITPAWIVVRMAEFGLSRNDVIKQVGVDKATLSEMLSGNKKLTKFHKAAFFYYLMNYEINRDVRELLAEQE